MRGVLLALACAQLLTSSSHAKCSPGCTCASTGATCAQANLTTIPDDLPRNITELNIDGATLRELRTIPNYPELTKLAISNSGLRYVVPRVFRNISMLNHLILDDNELTGLWSETFQGLESLRILSLEGNPLHVLHNNTFRGAEMPKLETLILRKCNLFKVEARAFVTLIRLEELVLDHNQLEDIPLIGSINGELETLKVLDLSHNRIRNITADPFSQLGHLTKLLLNSNKISSLSVTSFSGLVDLKELSLRDNQIPYVANYTFSGLNKLQDLDLSYNALTILLAYQVPSNLTSLHLHHNPWRCDCHLEWMLTNNAVQTTNSEIPGFVCRQPEALKNQSILQLNPNDVCSGPPHPYHSGNAKLNVVLGLVLSLLAVGAAIYVGCVLYRKHARKRALQYNSITRETEMFSI